MAAVGLIALVLSGSYRRWEAITVFLCLLDIVWIVLAWRTHTPAGQVVFDALVPQVPKGGVTSGLVFLVIAIVGTTIAPWQLFFQQSCVADKRLRFSDLKWARLDTFIGACFTIVIAGCMIMVGSVLHLRGIEYTDPAQMAAQLGPILGPFFKKACLLLMVNAAVLGTTAISLSSSWAYGEYKEWPHSLQKRISEAPGFYGVYAICVLSAAALVLIPRAPLQLIILGVQVLAGVVLPSAIIFLQLLLNDKEMLGEKWVNKRWNNIVNWTIISLFFVLSLILAAQVVAPNLFPAT
jgi:Mn2+/Fe2+ NRAMP family transporter